jgi:hypothetical protein
MIIRKTIEHLEHFYYQGMITSYSSEEEIGQVLCWDEENNTAIYDFDYQTLDMQRIENITVGMFVVVALFQYPKEKEFVVDLYLRDDPELVVDQTM